MSVADAMDDLEKRRAGLSSRPLMSIIEVDLLPLIHVADRLREAASLIERDGTPSQVGPSPDELRSWANMIRQDAATGGFFFMVGASAVGGPHPITG